MEPALCSNSANPIDAKPAPNHPRIRCHTLERSDTILRPAVSYLRRNQRIKMTAITSAITNASDHDNIARNPVATDPYPIE